MCVHSGRAQAEGAATPREMALAVPRRVGTVPACLGIDQPAQAVRQDSASSQRLDHPPQRSKSWQRAVAACVAERRIPALQDEAWPAPGPRSARDAPRRNGVHESASSYRSTPAGSRALRKSTRRCSIAVSPVSVAKHSRHARPCASRCAMNRCSSSSPFSIAHRSMMPLDEDAARRCGHHAGR